MDNDEEPQNQDNQNYNYAYQNSGEQNDQYEEEKLPPIYTEKIETIKETNEQQVINFAPIELAEGEDISKYLNSGKLMRQLAPKIQELKQEEQKKGMNNDPSVHTEIQYDIKQNMAIYDNPEENEDDEEDEKKDKEELKGQGGIKFSSVLPPKVAKMKVVTIDQYGNRNVEGNEDDVELEEGNEENNEQNIQEANLISQQQQQQLALQQEQIRQRQLEEQRLIQEKQKEQLLLQQKLKEEQMILEQKIQQEKLRQQQLQQEQIRQQQEKIRQQQLIQQQRLKLQQQQQNLITNKQPTSIPNQNNYPFMRAYSNNNIGNLNNFRQNMNNSMPMDIKTMKLDNQYNQYNNTIGMRPIRKDPLVQKVIKIYGTLRPRNQNFQNIQNNPNMRNIQYNPNISNNPNIQSLQKNLNVQKINNNIQNISNIQNSQNIENNQNLERMQNIHNIQNNQNIEMFQNIQNKPNIQNPINNEQYLAARKIQNKWRNHFVRNRFLQIKPQLLLESQSFLKQQYDICDKAGPIASDEDFNSDGWKRFYPVQDPFFNFDKGFVISCGIKIRHPNDPEKVSVYEGDININNERHGFGRLTTVKSVYLGEWRNGEFTGWGRDTRRSGKVYEGKFVNGLIQGKGILKNNKGTTYVGDFLDSKRHGKGILDTHTVHYEGEFKNDKLCGKGRIVFKIQGHVYEGDFENNEIKGFGTYKWKNGDSYTGYMMNGKMHGKGKYRYNNGIVYEGIYNNGVKQGKGKVYNTNGISNSEIQRNINQNNNSKKISMSGVSNTTRFSDNK